MDLESKLKIATKEHRGFHKYTFQQPLNTNTLRDTRNNTKHMVFEGELPVKLHAKEVEVALARMETPDLTKSPWGGFTVLDLLLTKALVLLGFSIMHQWIAPLLILAKFLVGKFLV